MLCRAQASNIPPWLQVNDLQPSETLRILNRIAAPAGHVAHVAFSDLHLDPTRREVSCGGRRIILKATSCRLLEALIANPEKIVSRSALFEAVWGIHFDPGTKVLEVQLSYLRKVLIALGCSLRIHTYRGIGLSLHGQQ
ncbi:winged helix-turn-helix domain-containing protein [Pseudomonas sp. DCB_BI]|uniref:winged helix-turn-helix domain-containing protein n=1 Tax=Pseudomonas TaxID=286 RepID=UPI003A4D7913|nr:winged helix-turn-helix transcriptional regulator [Pseudomonas sp. BN607]